MSDNDDLPKNEISAEDSAVSLDKKERARRKLLERAALGTGLIASSPLWVRPVVNTVVLPAHAQASGPLSPTTDTSSGSSTSSSGFSSSTLPVS